MKMDKETKKKVIYVICVFLIGSCFILMIPKLFSSDKLDYIEFDEITEKLDSKTEFFLLISKNECPYCEDIKAVLLNDDTRSLYEKFYVYEYSMEESPEITPIIEKIFPEFVFVPYVCYIKDGNIERYTGVIEVDEVSNWINSKQGE